MRRGTTAELRGWHQRFADRPLGVGQIGRVGAAGHHPTSEKPLCCEYPQTIPPSQTPSQTLLCEQRLRGCWSKKVYPTGASPPDQPIVSKNAPSSRARTA